jgi:putative transposase
MPRSARLVLPGSPHHVTQRGTDRQIVFHTQRDRRVYLDLLTEYSRQSGVGILAYCLMPNHIHLIAVPEEEDSLSICLRRTHGRYAQYHNARRVRSGHLWQNRFYSCAMEECHLWNAIRYVELNPVRAGLAESPERYRWSSAAAHLSGSDNSHLLDMAFWQQSGGAQNWQELLNTTATEGDTKRLRSAIYSGKPLGSEGFVKQAMAALATKMEEPITRFHPARASRFSEQEYTEVLASGG